MNPGTRTVVAFIAGCVVGSKRAAGVFDHGRSKVIAMEGVIGEHQLIVVNREDGFHMAGRVRNNAYELQDFGTNRQLRLTLEKNVLRGFDEASRKEFTGLVTGNLVYIFDHDDNQHHTYSV